MWDEGNGLQATAVAGCGEDVETDVHMSKALSRGLCSVAWCSMIDLCTGVSKSVTS
jgi:hypothetical protein